MADRKPKPFTIEILVRCSGDGKEWDMGLEKIPARKRRIAAKVMLEAAALLADSEEPDAIAERGKPTGLRKRSVWLRAPRRGGPS